MADPSDTEAAVDLACTMIQQLAPLFVGYPPHVVSDAAVRLAASLVVQLAKPECREVALLEASRWLAVVAAVERDSRAHPAIADMEPAGHG